MTFPDYDSDGPPAELPSAAAMRVAPLIAAVYEESCVGGGLHIVVDDGNVEANHIVWCIQNNSLTTAEMACATALLDLSVEQRLAALAFYEAQA
jgi:hypothetical protein